MEGFSGPVVFRGFEDGTIDDNLQVTGNAEIHCDEIEYLSFILTK